MVCVPCIVIPLLLWVYHKYIQPLILKYWNPWGKKEISDINTENIDTNTAEYKFIAEKIKAHPVILFSKSTCKFCKMAKEVLDSLSVDYAEEDIGTRDDCQAIQDVFKQITGERTVPRVFVGGKCIGGGSETWTLHNQGRLIPMLKEASAVFLNGNKKSD